MLGKTIRFSRYSGKNSRLGLCDNRKCYIMIMQLIITIITILKIGKFVEETLQFLLFATINIITRLTMQVKKPSNYQFSCTSVKKKLEKLACEPDRVI